MTDLPLLCSYRTAARWLDVSERQVARLVAERKLRVTYVCGPQCPRIPRAELERFARGEEPAQVEEPRHLELLKAPVAPTRRGKRAGAGR